MKGVLFKENPGPVHPNCKCDIEKIELEQVNGRDTIIVPPGVDLAANITEARSVARRCEEKAKLLTTLGKVDPKALIQSRVMIFALKSRWIKDNFETGARYDYKTTKGSQYEAFGNYHFGIYVKAMGINDIVAQVGAGGYQVYSGTSKWDKEWAKSWFDDPKDNEAIRKGQQYQVE